MLKSQKGISCTTIRVLQNEHFFQRTQYLKSNGTQTENKGSIAAGQEETTKKRVEVVRSPSAATSHFLTLMYAIRNVNYANIKAWHGREVFNPENFLSFSFKLVNLWEIFC